MKRALSLALIGVLLIGSSIALAQAPPIRRGPVGPDGAPTITLDFEDVDITDVIKVIAEITGKNFLYDERVRGRVTVISPKPVGIDEAYRVFESMLQVKGFTTIAGPTGILKVVPTREAKAGSLDAVNDARVQNRDLYVTRLIPLKFVEVDLVRNTIRPLMSADANMVAYAPTNTLILSDTSANVRRLLSIIRAIDVETYEQQIRIIPIEYADAGTLAGHLNDIFADSAGQKGRAGTTPAPARARRAAQAAAQAAAEGVIGEAGAPRFITDDRTNSLIVIATAPQLLQIEDLILLLDYEREGSGRFHVHRLQNADAENMAQTLANLVSGTPSGGAASANQAAASSAVAELEGGISITADAPTNSLIIQASAEGYGTLRGVIEALDTRRPQVMVEALVMEVNVTDDLSLGTAFIYNTLLGGSVERLAIGAGSVPATLSGAERFGALLLGKSLTPGGTVPVIDGLIRASGTNTDTNIISAPVILTADNESAEIIVAQNIPIPTGTVSTPSGQVNPGGLQNFNTSTTFTRQDVGVTLRVTPQISEGDMIRLEIFQEVSKLAGTGDDETSDATGGPTTLKRSVDNVVFVKDGEAVMTGGIIEDTQDETIAKVPFLGDIPILGWLFKSKSTSLMKTNLLVILTPRIVRHPDDLKRLTTENRERFRQFSSEALDRGEKEEESHKAAIRAGVAVPNDENPVRRSLEQFEKRYPVSELPVLRADQQQRQEERRAAAEAEASTEGARYVVRVATFPNPAPAVELLESLIGGGFDGTISSQPDATGAEHLVELGPFIDLETAKRKAREVQVETGLSPTIVVSE